MARAKLKNFKKAAYGKFTFILAALIIVISILNVPCYIAQYEKNAETKSLTRKLDEEINYGKRLQIEYKSRINYKDVEDYATNVLGMKKAENYQIQYIMKTKENSSAVVKNDVEDGFFSNVAASLSVIAEYFR